MSTPNNNSSAQEHRSTTDEPAQAMEVVSDHPVTPAPDTVQETPVATGQGASSTTTGSRENPRIGRWELHPTAQVPIHRGKCPICAEYFDHLCEDVAFGDRHLNDAYLEMGREARHFKAKCEAQEVEILRLRMAYNGMTARLNRYELQVEDRSERRRLRAEGDEAQVQQTWEPQTGQKRPAPAEEAQGDDNRQPPRPQGQRSTRGGYQGRGARGGHSTAPRGNQASSNMGSHDPMMGVEEHGSSINPPARDDSRAQSGGWLANPSPWGAASAPTDWATGGPFAAVTTTAPQTGGGSTTQPPSHGRSGGTLFPSPFNDAIGPRTGAAIGGTSSSTVGSGGARSTGQPTQHGSSQGGHKPSKAKGPSARWEVISKTSNPTSRGGAVTVKTGPSVVAEALAVPFDWAGEGYGSDDEDEECDVERDVPVRLPNGTFAVIHPENRSMYMTIEFGQFLNWNESRPSKYVKALEKAEKSPTSLSRVPHPLRYGGPDHYIELHPHDDGLWGWGIVTAEAPSDTGPCRIVETSCPITGEEGKQMVAQASSSMEGSIERIRLVRVAFAARATSRRTAGEVVVLESIVIDMIPPYPPYPGGTPEPSTATFEQVLEFYRGNPHGETPRGIRRHGGNPVPADVEAFHFVRAIGPRELEKEKKSKRKEKEKEGDKEKDNSPVRDWRLAAARVLHHPSAYEEFVAQRKLTIPPRPDPLHRLDAAAVPNITDDTICCHFVMNGLTVAEARRWRVWAFRAHGRIDSPHTPTPPMPPPQLRWIAAPESAPPAASQTSGLPETDVTMAENPPHQQTATGSSGGLPAVDNGSGGPDVPSGGGQSSTQDEGHMDPPPSTQPR